MKYKVFLQQDVIRLPVTESLHALVESNPNLAMPKILLPNFPDLF